MERLPDGRREASLVVGIDLGTTNSLLAIASTDAVPALPAYLDHPPAKSSSFAEPVHVRLLDLPQTDLDGTEAEEALFPSAVFVDEFGRRFCGIGARDARFLYGRGKRVFFSVKKDLGTEREPFYSGAVTPDLNTPVKVSAAILKAMKEAAQAKLGRSLDDVPIVITVPASFASPQRRDTVQAAAFAGFRIGEEGLFDEPNAALLAYIHRNRIQARWSPEETVLIFDFGGGTCDVSIVDVEFSPVRQVVHLRNRAISRFEKLGGDDIDQHLVHTYLKQTFYAVTGSKERDWGLAERRDHIWSQLAKIAELLKRRMCEELDRIAQNLDWNEKLFGHISVALPPQAINTRRGPVMLDALRLDYDRFKQAMLPFLDPEGLSSRDCEFYRITSIFAPIHDAMEKANLRTGDVTRILLVGGSSNNPCVQASLRSYFGQATIDRPAAMDRLVAEGAALHAYYHYVLGHDVMAPILGDTLGLQTEGGGFAPLISAGSPIPFPGDRGWQTYTDFRTPREAMDRVELVLCAGGAARPVHKVELRAPRPLPGRTPIHLRMRMDGNKVVHLEAFLPEHPGVRVSARIDNPLAMAPLTATERRRAALEQKLSTAAQAGALSQHVDEMVALAQVYNELDRYELADEMIIRAIRHAGQPSDRMRAIRALSHYGLGEEEEAHALYVDLETRSAVYAYMAGLTAPNLEIKEQYMRRAVETRPNDGVAYYGLGLALEDKGDYTGARAAFTRACGLLEARLVAAPTDTLTMSFLVAIYLYLGQRTEADQMRLRMDASEAVIEPEHDNRPAIAAQMNTRS